MKKIKIIKLISMIVLTLCLTVSAIYAWFANTKEITNIDGTTDGLSFAYKIGNNDTYNDKEFSVTNLAFFDIESQKESQYFVGMASNVKISIFNTGSIDVDIKYTQNDVPEYILDSTKDKPQDAFVLALFSENVLDSTNFDSSKSILENYTLYNSFEKTLLSGESTTLYMYLIGVQPNQDATSETTNTGKDVNFLRDSYLFSVHMFVLQEDYGE